MCGAREELGYGKPFEEGSPPLVVFLTVLLGCSLGYRRFDVLIHLARVDRLLVRKTSTEQARKQSGKRFWVQSQGSYVGLCLGVCCLLSFMENDANVLRSFLA